MERLHVLVVLHFHELHRDPVFYHKVEAMLSNFPSLKADRNCVALLEFDPRLRKLDGQSLLADRRRKSRAELFEHVRRICGDAVRQCGIPEIQFTIDTSPRERNGLR